MLPIDEQITFLYTADLQTTARFYEDILGLRLSCDQRTCRIYHVTGRGFLGICQRDDAQPDFQRRDIIITLVTPDVDGWYESLREKGVKFDKPPDENPHYRIYHCFLRDPNGYLIEIQRFLD